MAESLNHEATGLMTNTEDIELGIFGSKIKDYTVLGHIFEFNVYAQKFRNYWIMHSRIQDLGILGPWILDPKY